MTSCVVPPLLVRPPRLLSLGQVEDLRAQLAAKEAALEELRAMTPEAMWLRDLDAVEEGA